MVLAGPPLVGVAALCSGMSAGINLSPNAVPAHISHLLTSLFVNVTPMHSNKYKRRDGWMDGTGSHSTGRDGESVEQ